MLGVGAGQGAVWDGAGCGENCGGGDEEDVFELHCRWLDMEMKDLGLKTGSGVSGGLKTR